MPKKKKTNKGQLIKGMSNRLPISILDDPIFEEKLTKLMQRSPGIYALYYKDKLCYVGLTTNLQGRIRAHLKDRLRRKWDSFVIFRIKRVNFLKDIETLIMKIVETGQNKVKGKVPKSADININLHEILKEETKRLVDLKKFLKNKR